MIDIDLPREWLWALRWALFLGPLAAVLLLGARHRHEPRVIIGGLFAFLYGFAMIFATHQLAIAAGWWRYGGEVLMVMGLPADIWIGGAILFGPVLAFLFPTIRPLYLVLPIILGLHGMVFSSLDPLVMAGPFWFVGVVLVFLVAHLPAIHLARWTARGEHLAWRAALLALGYGFLAFYVLPSVIMLAMGGSWNLGARPLWLILAGLPVLAACFVLGLSAVQMFVVHGEGTPIPLDPTKRLVRTGVFAYLINPMQLSSALSWIVIGVIIGNVWVASAAVMAWVFVAGMVRWHHRHDLLQRFPEGWPTYRVNVPEWMPRWRPWVPEPAQLVFDPGQKPQAGFAAWLQRRDPVGLTLEAQPGVALTYQDPSDARDFTAAAALGKALGHVNLAYALLGAAVLLVVLPLRHLRGHEASEPQGGRVT